MIIVTSGAVGAGLSRLGQTERPKSIPERQAMAAIGQGLLMQTYENLFSQYGHTVAQVLLTREDITDRVRHLNARNALYALLRHGVIPIINENDTVSVEEIQFGDNDRLAALVSGLVDAELLILLSDVDGLYSADPRIAPDAELISLVTDIDGLDVSVGGPGSRFGSGGMASKVQAARIATQAGCTMVVANGSQPGVIHSILAGEPVGTLFVADSERRLDMRKRWIALFQSPQGDLIVDPGAVRALAEQQKSLLPIGVTDVVGRFHRGDLVRVCDHDGDEVARGLVNYSASQIRQIQGLSSDAVRQRFGDDAYQEVIHRDNLVVTTPAAKGS